MKQKIIEQATKLGTVLLQKKLTVTTVESCTGGGIAYAITAIPGSSGWFNEGFVTYSNQAKHKLVGVNEETINAHGAVSQETVEEMAQGARDRANASIAVSVSGIAGPDGGTVDKPVGTVWMCIATSKGKVWSHCFHFLGDRDQVRVQTILQSLIEMTKIAHDQF